MDIINLYMKDIAIYGAGGFGREVACLIRIINESLDEPRWNLIGFFDDGMEKGMTVSHFGPCLGNINDLNAWTTPLDVLIAIGNGKVIKLIYSKIHNENVAFPNVIHPSFSMTDKETCHIGKGNIIQGGCTFTTNVTLGDFNVLNGSVVFGHDVLVNDFNTFMPAVRISGEVRIGNGNFFGVGSIVLQQLKVGDDVKLAAGSVMMTKPKNGNLYMGVPAKIMKF